MVCASTSGKSRVAPPTQALVAGRRLGRCSRSGRSAARAAAAARCWSRGRSWSPRGPRSRRGAGPPRRHGRTPRRAPVRSRGTRRWRCRRRARASPGRPRRRAARRRPRLASTPCGGVGRLDQRRHLVGGGRGAETTGRGALAAATMAITVTRDAVGDAVGGQGVVGPAQVRAVTRGDDHDAVVAGVRRRARARRGPGGGGRSCGLPPRSVFRMLTSRNSAVGQPWRPRRPGPAGPCRS